MTIFRSENSEDIVDPSKKEVLKELNKLDGVNNSYACFEDNNCYIQVGGGPIEFTVEIRQTQLNGLFKHWKASLQCHRRIEDREIIISGSVVVVKSNQILNLMMVKELFEAFLDGNKLPQTVEWVDITSMFV